MGLRLKFNMVLVVVFAAGVGVSGWVSHRLLEENAKDEVRRNAGLMMEAALAIRGYTVSQVKPHIEDKLQETFLPQSVPAYAATETFNTLRKKYPDFSYKEATLNPTNPRDRAVEWETDIVNHFRNGGTGVLTGERDTPAGRMLYIAQPIQIKDPACLACHSVPSAAPASMIKLYGENNGFGWKHMEVIGAQVVSVPMSVPIKRADETFRTFMLSLAGVFVVTFVLLNAMLHVMVIRRVTRLSAIADQVSLGNLDAGEFRTRSSDEIGVLTEALGRMKVSLVQAMKMLE